MYISFPFVEVKTTKIAQNPEWEQQLKIHLVQISFEQKNVKIYTNTRTPCDNVEIMNFPGKY